MARFLARTSTRALLALALPFAAGACKIGTDHTGSISADYRQRHPIVLERANETLEIFVGPRRALDPRQEADVRAFGQRYMQRGEGPIVAYLPADGGSAVQPGLHEIRRALGQGGAAGRLHIAHYHPAPGAPPAIKLAFASLQAKVRSVCGYENDDLGDTSIRRNMANATAHNFGCAYQTHLAAQVDDPRDLIRPRTEAPVDTLKRVGAIERLRDGSEVAGQNELRPQGRSINRSVGPN